jgi:hypothetical protein
MHCTARRLPIAELPAAHQAGCALLQVLAVEELIHDGPPPQLHARLELL